MNKNQAKMTVTLSMIFIGAMALMSTPSWARAARDFITTKAGGTASAQPSGAGRSSGRSRLQ